MSGAVIETRALDELLPEWRTTGAPVSTAVAADEFATARERAADFQRLRDAWPELQIENVQVTDMSHGSIGIGEVFEVSVRVQLGSLEPDDVAAELYVGASDPAGQLIEPTVIALLREEEESEQSDDGATVYTGAYLPQGSGVFRYGVRVLPNVDFADAAHLGRQMNDDLRLRLVKEASGRRLVGEIHLSPAGHDQVVRALVPE